MKGFIEVSKRCTCGEKILISLSMILFVYASSRGTTVIQSNSQGEYWEVEESYEEVKKLMLKALEEETK